MLKVKADIAANSVGRDVTHAGLLINPGERDIEAYCQFFGSKKVICTLAPVLANCFPDGLRDDLFKLRSERIAEKGRGETFAWLAHVRLSK